MLTPPSHASSTAPTDPPLRVARAVCLALLLALAACGHAKDDDDPRPLVVCTTGMIADLARAIGADDIRTVQLVRAGIDPHLYTPTRDDVRRLAAADLILYNGLLLEGRMSDALQRLGSGGKRVVAVAETLPKEMLMADPDQGNQPDPHVWMDVSLWAMVAEHVRDELTTLLPESADAIHQRCAELLDQVQILHDAIQAAVATIPDEQRVLVTAHDAFGYFGRAYGIKVRGIQGFSTESEAGLRDINELVDFLVERKIAAVFVESTVSDRNVRALVEGTRARGHALEIGGELFSDSTGPEGTPEGTYPGMMEHNARTIVTALGGTWPEATPARP